ncbi:hypothetical protein RF11_13235 [Thelohanellus kitauei]|uniref:Uncharacterized protein n=1 Tax=Thelohanellus kitauei TaxID=669202 RepID=A0A0C2ME01_THEKT|nr:hypothetical protein RF11_13235 [Thelohanellus kitauei]
MKKQVFYFGRRQKIDVFDLPMEMSFSIEYNVGMVGGVKIFDFEKSLKKQQSFFKYVSHANAAVLKAIDVISRQLALAFKLFRSTDITDIAQLADSNPGFDKNINITEEFFHVALFR